MKDIVKEMKFEKANVDLTNYKKYMCSKCNFYINEECSKKRIVRVCAKKGLRNKD